MDVTVRRLAQRTVQAIEQSMQDEIRAGMVELHGTRVINTVTFKGRRDPAKYVEMVGSKSLDFPEHSRALSMLTTRMARQLGLTTSAVAR